MAQASVNGQWQTLPYTVPINPIHVALLHTGKVLIVSGSGNLPSNLNFQAGVWDPHSGTITTQPVGWDMFCNGMVVLPDGRPFIMGGTLQYDPFHGELRASVYDPATNAFTDLQSMAHGRWYPTATVLGDGRVMVFSGFGEAGGTNTSVEFYSASSGWSAAFSAPWTPPLYPRLHLLPNGNVFYSGSTTGSSLFNPATRTWTTNMAFTNYNGIRTYGSSVLLPLTPANNYTPKVMIMGGGNPSTASTELIDLSAGTPKWVYGPNMSQPRIEMNATILPNGKVLALGGSLNDEDTNTASLNADLYDPASNTFSPAGTEVYARLYHCVSLLLPDGTVWVAGGNPQRGTYEPHMEIYSPAYLFNPDGTLATRPAITGTSSSVIGYNGAFQVQTPDAANISSVVLMRNGADTHSFDMDQRYVGLSFTTSTGVLSVTSPPNSNIAPPGYYMLFILSTSGVPSLAAMVQVSAAAIDLPPTGTISSPASNVTITAGQSVSYSGTGSDADGTISAYAWSFRGGNPNSSTLANPGNVTYSTPGSYVTTLTVTDNSGLTDPHPPTRTITVQSLPSLSLSTTMVSFGNQSVGTTSSAKIVSLTNTGSSSLTFSGIVITGANGGDFSQTNDCPISSSTLAPQAGCNIRATFKPMAGGNRSASVQVTDDASGSPQSIALTGTGAPTAPVASLSAASVIFGNHAVGTSSAAQSVTLTNSGNAALNIASIAIGGANSGDFSQTNSCGAGVAAGANCMISLTFKPMAGGNRSASVQVTDDASGSPQSIALTGTGMTSTPTLSALSLTFPGQLVTTSSAAQSVTLTNSGNAALNIASIAIVGANSGDFSQTNTCGTRVAVSANCTIGVNFKPTASGNRSASVAITDDASGGSQGVTVTGTATDFSIDAANGTSTSATISVGQTAIYSLQVTPLSGFNGTVALSCTGAPSQASCTVLPALASATASTFTATVTTTAPSVSVPHTMPPSRLPVNMLRFALPLLLTLILFALRARWKLAVVRYKFGFAGAFLLVSVPLIAAGLSGCASIGAGNAVVVHNAGTPRGTYTLTVTGTSGGVSHTRSLALTVN